MRSSILHFSSRPLISSSPRSALTGGSTSLSTAGGIDGSAAASFAGGGDSCGWCGGCCGGWARRTSLGMLKERIMSNESKDESRDADEAEEGKWSRGEEEGWNSASMAERER